MSVLKDSLAILWVLVVISQMSQGVSNTLKHVENGYPHRNVDRTCNSENNCQCGDGHNNAVVCDDKLKESAVLDCNCVTYDKQSEATYLGLCFYNCQGNKVNSHTSCAVRRMYGKRNPFVQTGQKGSS